MPIIRLTQEWVVEVPDDPEHRPFHAEAVWEASKRRGSTSASLEILTEPLSHSDQVALDLWRAG